tara:strand:- start:1017 stop:1391 length:375 start_codon:yes stop_codon:yes gene_type:complete
VEGNLLGCYAEYLFVSECLKRGKLITMPVLDSSPYDCIVESRKKLYKVQVKATEKKPYVGRRTINAPLNNSKSKYTKEVIDFFAVYSAYFEGFFIFPNTGNMQSIRLSKHGKNKIFFNNFEFIV